MAGHQNGKHLKGIEGMKRVDMDDEAVDEPSDSFIVGGATTYRTDDGETYYMDPLSNRAMSTHRDGETPRGEDEFTEIQGVNPEKNDLGGKGYRTGHNSRRNGKGMISSKSNGHDVFLATDETPRQRGGGPGDRQLRNHFDDIVNDDGEAAMSIFSSPSSTFEKKALAWYFLFLIIFSIFLNIVEFTYFADTPCDIEKALLVENDGSHSWVYNNLNFVYTMMYMLLVHKILVKLGMINFLWEGMMSKKDSLGVPAFVLPLIVLGGLPAFMMTNYIYDFNTCERRNSIFNLDQSMETAAAFGIINLVLYFALFLLCLFVPSFKIKKRAVKLVRSLVYLVFAIYMVVQLAMGLMVMFDVLGEEFLPPLTLDLILFCSTLVMFIVKNTMCRS